MLFKLPDDETLYQALLDRDPAYEGHAYVGVTSTKIFCRLTCSARKPKRENTRFYDSVAGCLEAGFRPCKRCKPLERTGEPGPMISELVAALEADPEHRWSEADIIARGHDPSTVRRAFKRHFGLTFLDMARLRRLGRAVDSLEGGASVIEAQLDAGFDSGSGFRAAFSKLVGTPPAGLRATPILRADWLATPIGPMIAVADQHVLHLLEFHDRPALPRELAVLQKQTRSGIAFGRTPVMDQLADELGAYFDGRAADFQTPLSAHGTEFERECWRYLRQVRAGTTQSYGGLASEMGRPTASRAVARANGANRIAIILPCHRIIGADGSLTGYGGGLWRKRWLLEHERRSFGAG